MNQQQTQNMGWRVATAATLSTLAIGFIYAWSIWARGLVNEFGFTPTQSMYGYTTALAMMALMMLPGGRLFDKFGPRVVSSAGGVLIFLGMLMMYLSPTVTVSIIGFGLLVGIGAGCTYGCCLPTTAQWFPPQKRGLMTGIVVAGLGLAAVYAAPLSLFFIEKVGMRSTFLYYGAIFGAIVVILAQFLKLPPKGYIPPGTPAAPVGGGPAPSRKEYGPSEIIRTPQFWSIYLMFCFGATAGLMVIGHISYIAGLQAGIAWGVSLVAILAIFNSAGRIVGGFLSDKIGQPNTLLIMLILQAVNMVLFRSYTSMTTLVVGVCITGVAYGALLGIFPSLTYKFFGLKNAGANYGAVFTAFGIAGYLGPVVAGNIVGKYGAYNNAYIAAAVLLVIAALLSFIVRKSPQA